MIARDKCKSHCSNDRWRDWNWIMGSRMSKDSQELHSIIYGRYGLFFHAPIIYLHLSRVPRWILLIPSPKHPKRVCQERKLICRILRWSHLSSTSTGVHCSDGRSDWNRARGREFLRGTICRWEAWEIEIQPVGRRRTGRWPCGEGSMS